MKKHQSNQDGFAALVIAIVLVLVLSLITVGFAELMRREERSALDRQLSSQAYYAAESGINDATKAINGGYKEAKTTCGPISSVPDLADNKVKFTDGNNPTAASYPCLLINPSPPSLHYDPITTNVSRTAVFTLLNSGGTPANVSKIKISWQDSGDNKTFVSNCNTFSKTTSWNAIGVLRAQLTPLIPGGLDRTTLTNKAFTGFLCPSTAASSSTDYASNIGPANAGVIMNGGCNTTTGVCSATINFPAAFDTSTFLINLRSLYSATSVTMTATDAANNTLYFKGAQTLVDSTGKAQDVLRRIQVRVASSNGFDIPDGVHGDVCKQFDLDPVTTTSAAPSGSDCNVTNLTY